MPSKENLDPVELRLRELRARRANLTAKLQRIQDLTAANKLLREKIAFLRQRLRELQENLDFDSEGDKEARKEE